MRGPELLSKWVGESEKAVRSVFRKAQLAAPSVIFFDEIDAIARKRDSSSSSRVADRVLSQLLSEIDGIETLSSVVVIAATNRPDVIDPALLRPGRFDRIVYVPPPDAQARYQIFELSLPSAIRASDVDINQLVEATEGLTGAQIVGLCREAGMISLRENVDAQNIHMTHLNEALSIIIPSITFDALEFYRNFSRTHSY